MIHHIVMWQLEEVAEGKTKAENAILIKERLEALKSEIPEIAEIRVGINIESIAGNFDVVLHSYFNTIADLGAYQVHPKHIEVAGWVGKVKSHRACVDYEF